MTKEPGAILLDEAAEYHQEDAPEIVVPLIRQLIETTETVAGHGGRTLA